jgi:hypothetical protein
MGLTTMLVLLPFYLQLLLLLKNPLLLLPTIPFFETIPLSLFHTKSLFFLLLDHTSFQGFSMAAHVRCLGDETIRTWFLVLRVVGET